ncbi:MAG: hypothetical protein KKC75_07555 [Nanoarchaeota archaeon]|nr:hypothetical protein [Nanoarchaeota archaeon]MBU1004318.1 hypothetical protein [Nanoarchaeota archaeon]MBU1945464.1 hypothetical protein [Nanoarchaeota archaeon]
MSETKKGIPLGEYESQCWSPDAERRWDQLRQVINPTNLDLLTYYPGSGGETIISRGIGAGTQVQVNLQYEHGAPFLVDRNEGVEFPVGFGFRDFTPEGKDGPPDGQRRVYPVQWLSVVDYWGDAMKIVPPEIQSGIDVFIDKCSLGFRENFRFKALVYNLIKEKGHLIDDGEQNFFLGFDPKLVGLDMVLDRTDRSSSKGEPFHLRVFKKNKGLYIPEGLFEADLAVAGVMQDRERARYYASQKWDYTPKVDPIVAQQKLGREVMNIQDTELVKRLREFSREFF